MAQSRSVWILSRGEAYEGSDIEGVFEDKDDAMFEAQKLMDMSSRKEWSKLGSDEDMTWKSGRDVITLTLWQVGPKK